MFIALYPSFSFNTYKLIPYFSSLFLLFKYISFQYPLLIMDPNQGFTLISCQLNNLHMPPASLPLDILIDILIRLPAKPLMRFKCVCWDWYDLINAPHFAQLHLDTSISTHSNLHFVCTKPLLHMADFDTFDNPVELGYPFKDLGIGHAFMIGYSNGLLCIWDGDYFNYTVAVFNPTTRTHTFIPYLPRPSHCYHLRPIFISGFAHHAVDNDYKFVRICQCFDKETNYSYAEVMVYSLRSDTWTRVLDHVPYDFSACRSIDGVFLYGSLHWVLDSQLGHPPNPIVGFNLSTNTFFDLHVPDIDLYLYSYMHVGELDGCLCIVLNYVDYHEIWIMKEYGVVESWTRLYRVEGWGYNVMEKPVGFTMDRKVMYVRLCLMRVTTLDLETMEIHKVEAMGNPSRIWNAYICVENLFMLDYFSDYPEVEHQEDPGTSKKRRKRKGKKKKKKKRRRKRT